MPETAQTGKSKPPAGGAAKTPVPKHAPKRFDPSEHGGVKQRGWLFLFGGVILPTMAILFETNFHFCAHHFFDPFPSAGHVVLFALIPFSNFLVWLGTRRDLSNHYAFMSLISGMAMGVACLYTLMFLPLTPMACLFSLAFGFGLLGLAPLLSLPCNWISGKTVCRLAARKITYFNAHQVEHLGHMIILVMVIAIELPSTLTRISLSRAADSNPTVSRDGVSWLRRFGSQEVLLRACYERSGRATDILGSLYESAHPLNVDEARRVFYQVTGKPFNSVPIPRSARATIQHTGVVTDANSPNAGVEDEFDIDTDIAGEAVSGVARGLSVSQSKFEGSIQPDAALASLSWSFAFTNDSKIDREARAKILLPPHAVVTKATLTVNNVERDATIMVRSTARARYRQAVAEHKDPLLVSTCGTDQVLVQCFPVRPGETMKVKLHVAAPMDIEPNEKATLLLPAFLERNFQVDGPNLVDIQCSKTLAASGLTLVDGKAKDGSNNFHLTGQIDASHLAGFNSIIEADRDKSCRLTWCKAAKLGGNLEIERVLTRAAYSNIKNLIVVIDGSGAMQQFMPQIADGLLTLQKAQSAQIEVVQDNVLYLCPAWSKAGDPAYASALATLKKVKAEGGQDDFAAVYAALTSAALTKDTAVVWIHAAQPVTSGTSFAIKANLDRANGRPLLFDMQLIAGPNALLNGISGHSSLVRVERAGTVAGGDLAALLASCLPTEQASVPQPGSQLVPSSQPDMRAVTCGTAPKSLPVVAALAAAVPLGPVPRAVAPLAPGPEYQLIEAAPQAPAGPEVDMQLAQIWADRQICLELQNPDAGQGTRAGALADAFQIVSPVSSAIVTSPEPSPKPSLSVQAKPAFSIEMLSPRHAMQQMRRSIASAYQKQVDQLDSLSSAASSGEAQKMVSNDIAASNLPARSVTGPAQGSSGEGEPNIYSSLGGEAKTEVFPAATTAKSAQMEEKKERDLPPREGTGGTIAAAPEGGRLQSRENYFLKYPVVPSAPMPSKDGRSEDEKALVGADEPPAPPAKIVPEADTWLLLIVAAVLLSATWLFKRRKVDKA